MQQAGSDGDPVYVPSITLVEIAYLVEKNRLPQDLLGRIIIELEDDQSVLAMAPLDMAVARALPAIPRTEVPDMPDRIIAATALANGLPLITRDHRIRASSVHTIW
jgi:predicted nucleic acid-binding protein